MSLQRYLRPSNNRLKLIIISHSGRTRTGLLNSSSRAYSLGGLGKQKDTGIWEDANTFIQAQEDLKPGTAIVFLEDILTRHQKQLNSRTAIEGELRMLDSLTMMYVQRLTTQQRPFAAIEFMKKLVIIKRNRTKFPEEPNGGARLVMTLEMLYILMRQFGRDLAKGSPTGDPVKDSKERWEIIKEANRVVSQLTPRDWPRDAARTLRMERAQILQFYTSEELQQVKTADERKVAMRRAITNHETILQLGTGVQGDDDAGTRSLSLQEICKLKEAETEDDYRVYAREFNEVARPTEEPIQTQTAQRYLLSFVMCAQAHMRARKWEEALEYTNEGLITESGYPWLDDTDRPLAELCRLYVYQSQCRLKRADKEPIQALADARVAYKIAQRMPSDNINSVTPSESSSLDEVQRHDMINFSLNNLVDVLYERDVECPEEEYGLKAATQGVIHNKDPKSPKHAEFATIFQRKRIRALIRLERWVEALVASRDLLKALISQLSTTSKDLFNDTVNEIVTCCENVADSLNKLGYEDAATNLLDAADEFDEYVERNARMQPSASAVTKARGLEKHLESVIEEINSPARELKAADSVPPGQLQIESAKAPGRLASIFGKFINDDKNTTR